MAKTRTNSTAAESLNTAGNFTFDFGFSLREASFDSRKESLSSKEKEELFKLHKKLQTRASEIDWDSPLANFCAPKPIEKISEDLHREIYNKGEALYPKKYDGVGAVARHEKEGWRIYTLDNIDISDSLKHVISELDKKKHWSVGTMLHGEVTAFFEGPGQGEKRGSVVGYLFSKEERRREGLKNSDYVLPTFVVFDILFENRVDTGFLSFAERASLYEEHLPAARESEKALVKAEYYEEINPENWQANVAKDGLEGFVLIDKSIRPGLVWSDKKSHRRPKGKWKLKPTLEEDVVIYAVHCHEDGIPRSVFIKQIDPKSKKWFQCGKISVANRKAVIEALKPYLDNKLPVIATNKDLKDPQIARSLAERSIDISKIEGLVVNAMALQRFSSGRFDAPKFVTEMDGSQEVMRIRRSKKVDDCFAQYLPEGEGLSLSYL